MKRTSALIAPGLWLLAGLAVLALVASALRFAWPPAAVCTTTACAEAREWLAFASTTLVILGGLYQYRRAQQWKRAEFLAAEMRSFFDTPHVRNALTMIDWSRRQLDLTVAGLPQRVEVTRKDQSHALLPHVVEAVQEAWADGEAAREYGSSDSQQRGFSHKEAAIRDCYDVFLDGLERFANYVATGLVAADDLRPYLGYWIDDIAAATDDAADAEWTACLFAYIQFYGFAGVQGLFKRFGHDIRCDSGLFRHFLHSVTVANRDDLARALQKP